MRSKLAALAVPATLLVLSAPLHADETKPSEDTKPLYEPAWQTTGVEAINQFYADQKNLVTVQSRSRTKSKAVGNFLAPVATTQSPLESNARIPLALISGSYAQTLASSPNFGLAFHSFSTQPSTQSGLTYRSLGNFQARIDLQEDASTLTKQSIILGYQK